MAKQIQLNVNGQARAVEAEPDMPLLYALRDNLEMKEPRFGCGLAQCGACTVLLDGVPTRSCITGVGTVGKRKITTVAGIGTPSSSTVQAPHCARPQPKRGSFMARLSRSAYNKGMSGSASTACACPLTLN